MNFSTFVKRLENIMRKDAGINGTAQRIEQIVWILFLKVYDEKEKIWEFYEEDYRPIIPERLRWRNWAHDAKDGQALTGESLLDFVNNELFPQLKNLEITTSTPKRHLIARAAFEDNNNYMKDGVSLRQVINVIDEIDFDDHSDRHALGDIYENILRSLQSAGHSGEFYTPRALTDFIVAMIDPRLGETIADFACGTGGFLTSSLKHLKPQISTVADRKQYSETVFGCEKKALPFLLCSTNMLLHEIDSPNIMHGNALDKRLRDYKEADKYDLILMNPPYGGSEDAAIQQNFPAELRSSETADLFMALIMQRLRKKGRAAVVLPEGLIFGDSNVQIAIKKKLLSEFNLHTIIRLPHSVFAPYTSIHTNVLFFDATGSTEETWFYRLDMPEGYKNFSKTKPMQLAHFAPVMDWWQQREEIIIDGFDKARKYTPAEIAAGNYSLDYCKFPKAEEEILPPAELIAQYQEKRASLNAQIDSILTEITQQLGITIDTEKEKD